MPVESSVRGFLRSFGSPALCALAFVVTFAACDGGRPAATSQASHPVGSLVDHPAPFGGSLRFFVDPNTRGQASQLRITQIAWGRLVTVRDQLGAIQHRDMVIGEDVATDGVDYQLDTNAITLETTLTILHPYTPSVIIGGIETSPYQRALARIDRNLVTVDDKSLEPSELPPFTLVPRNSALVIAFNDLLDESLVSASTVRLLTGYPPTAPLDARVIPDPNHGDSLDVNGDGTFDVFHPTRIIVDPSVSPLESVTSSPAIPSNVQGLPASITTNQPNVALRIPTREDEPTGQLAVLRNLSAHALSFSGNGSRDDDSITRDIVRAVRSGGRSQITGDLNNGFLADDVAPRIVGSQAIVIGTPSGGPTEFTSALTFLTAACAMPTKIGDVLQQPGIVAEVTAVSTPVGAQIPSVSYRIVSPTGGVFTAGQGTISSLWDPVLNVGKAACFVRFPSISAPPDAGVATDSPVVVRFSEPMDPQSVSPFGSFAVSSGDPAQAEIPSNPRARQIVVSRITPAADAQEFRYQPVVPLAHTTGTPEPYWVIVESGAAGATDLAGNRIDLPFPVVRFTLDPTQGPQRNGHIMLRFSTFNEIPETAPNANPEVRGQFQLDFVNGQLMPRPLNRFAATVDRTEVVPGAMTFAPAPEVTPISRFGSKLMTVWRYCDVGFLLEDESKMNVDVERLAWSPRSGNVITEIISQFRISLAHSIRLPDEGFDPITMSVFPASGLQPTYEQNLLSPTFDPLREVHPRELGYTVNASDRYTATSGTVMMPYPLNRGIPQSEFRYYTWRDTSIIEVGGADSAGVEMAIANNLVMGAGPIGMLFPPGSVPTTGLPLLMEFRCYPDDGVLNANGFDVSQANLFSSPIFRCFSTGGVVAGGPAVVKNPDLEPTATGGFNPTTGAQVSGTDNTVYIGEMNLVTRIARAHTIWFSTAPELSPNTARFAPAVLEPTPENQPTGTSVTLSFRGATSVTGVGLTTNATVMNYYGDLPAGTGVQFLNGNAHWRADPSQINGANFFQVRINFIGNAQTNLMPSLSAFGVAFFQ